jgi:hypothetical protein
MLTNLELYADKLEDVVIGAEGVKEYQKEARWLAIGKVYTSRSFSFKALTSKMNVIWNMYRDPIFREVGGNLFSFQMHLGDWKMLFIREQGPFVGGLCL